MEILSLVIKIVLCVCSVFLVGVILIQENDTPKTVGNGGVSSKARGKSAFYAKWTKITAIVFMVLAVALLVIDRLAR